MIAVPYRDIALDEPVDVFGQEVMLLFLMFPDYARVEYTDPAEGHFEIVVATESPTDQLTVVRPENHVVGIENRRSKHVGNTHDVVEELFDGLLVLDAGAALEIGFAFIDQRNTLDEFSADHHFPLQQILLQKRKINIPGYRADAANRDEGRQRKNPQQSPSLDEFGHVHDASPFSDPLAARRISAWPSVRAAPLRHDS